MSGLFRKSSGSIKSFSIPITVVLVVFALFNVSFAEAGFFSDFVGSLSALWNGMMDESSLPTTEQNSQTALLLESALNSSPSAGVGGAEIDIVNDSALVAELGPLGSMADIEEESLSSDRISVYVVREGDSLSQIAEMFGVSVNTVIWANDIQRGDLIQTGQVLIILPVTGVRHTIKKGDTLASIAKKFKSDVNEIALFNDLNPEESLSVGEEVIIPDGEIPHVAPKQGRRYARSSVRNSGGPNYVGYYQRPITGGIRTQGLHGYNAVDLASYCGAPILAAATGDVIISRSWGWNGGYGNYIVISHSNGTQTLYAHNSKNIVTTGWHVVKGQVLGYMGSTGKSTGCHVHFEVRGAKNPF